MGTGAIFLFGVTGGGSGGGSSGTNIIIDTNKIDYNVLTAATALGYDNSSGVNTTITVTINAGVNVTASGASGTAFTTGALNANTTLSIINNGNIQGSNGSNGGNGGNGGSGGKGIFFNTITGGSATHSLENNGTISGGGGGGGSGGHRRTCYDDGDGGHDCTDPVGIGSAGAVGGLGQNGQAGQNPPIMGDCDCGINPTPGSGGSGGDSIDKNGRTVSQSGTGTYNGTQRA
jgi:hypothetical protein